MATKEVLVAVDGSPRSSKLVSLGARLAKDLGASVHLLYVAPQNPIPEEYKDYAAHENIDEAGYNDAVGRAIIDKLEGAVSIPGVEWDSDVEVGNPSSTIVKFASQPGVLLAVVGLRGLHGVGRVRSLGSVARRVVENSPVPVVVVPT